MKAKTFTYWAATILLCGFMAFAATAYLSRNPMVMAVFASLGYPRYFPLILGVAKLLGVLALLLPALPRLKEWAYAGFTFTFVGAFLSHLASGQRAQLWMPLAASVLLATSYFLRPARQRRSAAELPPASPEWKTVARAQKTAAMHVDGEHGASGT